MSNTLYCPGDYWTMLSAFEQYASNYSGGQPVVWGTQTDPTTGTGAVAPPLPFIKLQALTQPVLNGQMYSVPDPNPVLAITTIANNAVYSATMQGNTFNITSGSSATAQSIQASLLSAIQTEYSSAYALTSTAGVCGINLGAPIANSLFTAVSSNLSLQCAQYTKGQGTATISVDIFYKDITTQGQTIATLQAGLETQDTVELFAANNIGFLEIVNYRSMPSIAGSKWMLRDGFDVKISMGIRLTQFNYTIDSFNVFSNSLSGGVHN